MLANPLIEEEETWSNRNIVLQKDAGDTMDIMCILEEKSKKQFIKCDFNATSNILKRRFAFDSMKTVFFGMISFFRKGRLKY